MSRPTILRVGLIAMALAFAPARFAPAFEEKPSADHGTAGAHATSAAGHEEGQPNILEFKPSLMVSTLLVFGILLAVLWKFAWGPLSEALAERERKQEEVVRHAEEARAESARLLNQHKLQMDSAAEQVRQMLEDARKQADVHAQTIVSKAQAEAESSRERAQREIGTAKDQALNEIWSKTADLAVSVAGKVLSKEMNHDDHRRLVDSAMSELPSANGHGGRHG